MPEPTLTPIKSSMATHAHYDPQSQALRVKFSNGSVFRYDNVPHNIGETVMGAASFGTSFNRHVAGKYSGAKL
jgi:hypothetical protein